MNPRRLSSRFQVAVFVVASSATIPAQAGGSAVAARAKVLSGEAKKLMSARHYAEACPKYEESQGLDPGVGTSFSLADCWEKTGEHERARALFLEVAEKTHEAGDVKRERAARKRADAIVVPPAPVVEEPVPVVEVPPVVAEVPPVVVTSHPVATDPTDVEAMSAELRDEYGTLAAAAATLQELKDRAARLGDDKNADERARRLSARLDALEQELAGTWKLAGRVTAQVAFVAEHVPKALRRSASDAKAVPAPETTGSVAEPVATSVTASPR